MTILSITPNNRSILKQTDRLRSHQTVCIIMAAVIRSDSVVPCYTNPAPWQIFRFPGGVFSTSGRSDGVFILQESDICHVFLHLDQLNLYTHTHNTPMYQMLQLSRYGTMNVAQD